MIRHVTGAEFLGMTGALWVALAAGAGVARAESGAAWQPAAATPAGKERKPVKTADDLPRHTYPLTGKALEVVNDDAKFFALVDAALADALADLEAYDIQDPATLKGYYEAISSAYVVKGDLEKALAFTEKAKALETKESEKVTRGLALRARIAAERAAGGLKLDDPTFRKVFREELKKLYTPLPIDLIRDRLVNARNQAKMVTPQLVEASVAASLDPLIAAGNGKVGAEIVSGLVDIRQTLRFGLPLLPVIAEVFGEVLEAGATGGAAGGQSEDRWTPRLVELSTSEQAKPVTVAVWDSGVDTSLFADRLWTNPAEKANGKDDDGNGFVDDLHGIAFSLERKPTTGPLASLEGLKGDKDRLMGFVAASQDMQAGVSNPGVEAYQAFMRSINAEQMRTFNDDMGLIGNYTHGTHVAGITVAGNPFIRLMHVTENWPFKSIPDRAPTVEDGKAWGESCKAAVAYLKKADVRVVNMSWRVSRSIFEGMLTAAGAGATPEERAELSRQIFAGLRDGLREAITSAPEILFIAGSGNEDNDVDFAEYVPAGLKLPNLLTVGAVNQKDAFTSFTSTGKGVSLYANGYRIESVVPGGQKIKFSGTSMAAPQTSNLAAKILALRPELKPAEVVKLISDHAEPVPGQAGRFVINPKRTIEAVRAKAAAAPAR